MNTTLATPPAHPATTAQYSNGGLVGQTMANLAERSVPQQAQETTPPVKQEALADRGIGQKLDTAV